MFSRALADEAWENDYAPYEEKEEAVQTNRANTSIISNRQKKRDKKLKINKQKSSISHQIAAD